MAQHIKDFFEDKARAGDARYAIAYAIIDLADSQATTARALNRLGLADAATPMGAIEHLSLELKNAARLLAESIEIGLSARAD